MSTKSDLPDLPQHRVLWRVRAVVDADSVAFARGLEKELTAATEADFSLQMIVERNNADGGLVMVFQKLARDTTDVEDGPAPKLQERVH